MAAVPTRLKRWAAGVLVASAAWAAGAQQPDQARTVAVPQRIISLVPATTEMLFAMGAGPRVAAVGSYDAFPPEADRLPKVGGLLDPNVERVLALKPDLVVLYNSQTELKEQLQRAGIPIFSYIHRDLSDVTETMRRLGERVGAQRGAESAAAAIEQQLAAIRQRLTGRPRPKTLLVFGRESGSLRQINASGGYGFLHDMLEIGGGMDALADIKRESVMMSSEMVIARAPEVIIELHYGQSLNREDTEAERRVWNALPSVPAVRTGRVYMLTGNEFVVPGPRIAQAVDRLARTLHPGAFEP
jgi:iron complex transport system substrate-binding protein